LGRGPVPFIDARLQAFAQFTAGPSFVKENVRSAGSRAALQAAAVK
jgi:hypothetical protein